MIAGEICLIIQKTCRGVVNLGSFDAVFR